MSDDVSAARTLLITSEDWNELNLFQPYQPAGIVRLTVTHNADAISDSERDALLQLFWDLPVVDLLAAFNLDSIYPGHWELLARTVWCPWCTEVIGSAPALAEAEMC